MRGLTQNVLQVTVLEILHIFVLAEEILVDVPPSEQPHVRVVGDGPVRVVGPVQSCALGLSLHRCDQERHAKEPQQLLVTKEKCELQESAFCSAAWSSLFTQTLNTTNLLVLGNFLTLSPFMGS